MNNFHYDDTARNGSPDEYIYKYKEQLRVFLADYLPNPFLNDFLHAYNPEVNGYIINNATPEHVMNCVTSWMSHSKEVLDLYGRDVIVIWRRLMQLASIYFLKARND